MMPRTLFVQICVIYAVIAAFPAMRGDADAATGERRVALVIGNGKYTGVDSLPNPPNDARAVAAALRRLNFNVEEVIDAEKADMDYVVQRFSRQLKEADVGLFFYAGHGMQIDGENYLVPVDAKFTRDLNVSKQLVGLTRFVGAMEKGPKVNLVFLDACRNNPLADVLKKGLAGGRSITLDGARRARSVGQGLAEMKGIIGALIAYATQPGNVAEDGDDGNSPFTTAILKHIEAPGLEVRQFLTRVRVGVLEQTARRQVPWDHSSLTVDFFFKAAEKPAFVPLPPP